MANSNLYFTPVRPLEWKEVDLPMIASVAIAANSAVYAVGDGTHTKSTNSSGNWRGILIEPIAATDADYATSLKLKKCLVPKTPLAELFFTVGAGTFTTTDIGKTVKLNDEKGLAVDVAGTQAMITGIIDSTHGKCILNTVIS